MKFICPKSKYKIICERLSEHAKPEILDISLLISVWMKDFNYVYLDV